MTAFIAYDISKKRKVIAFLFVWTFVHFILFMFGGGASGSVKETFYPFTGYRNSYDSNPYFDLDYYDMTELTVYVGAAWLIFFLYYYLQADKKGRY